MVVMLGLLILFFLMVWQRVPVPVRMVQASHSHARHPRRVYDLRRRRAWFAEGDDDTDDDNGVKSIDKTGLPDYAVKYMEYLESQNADLKKETIGRRKYIERIDPELEALRKQQETQLKEQGKYKDLYEQTIASNAELKMKADRADAYEQMIKSSNEAKMAQVPDDYKPMVESLASDLSPEKLSMWLDQNMSKFTTPRAPDIGAGEGTGGGQPVKLTPEEEIAFKAGGFKDKAEYLEYKKKAGQIQ